MNLELFKKLEEVGINPMLYMVTEEKDIDKLIKEQEEIIEDLNEVLNQFLKIKKYKENEKQ